METVCDDSDLARPFRDNFAVVVYPLMNPDGVREGYWRHNINGVDTNRDWQQFRQPEPRAIRDDLLATDLVDVVFALDFHSTQKTIFYVLEESEGPRRLPAHDRADYRNCRSRRGLTLPGTTAVEQSAGIQCVDGRSARYAFRHL